MFFYKNETFLQQWFMSRLSVRGSKNLFTISHMVVSKISDVFMAQVSKTFSCFAVIEIKDS